MKVAFHTLGCKVNQYETEAMREQFEKAGFQSVGEEDFADVYVINTCTVTNISDRKSRQMLRRVKEINKDAIVVACGCYAQVAKEELEKIPEIDLIYGTNEKNRIAEYIEMECPLQLGTLATASSIRNSLRFERLENPFGV